MPRRVTVGRRQLESDVGAGRWHLDEITIGGARGVGDRPYRLVVMATGPDLTQTFRDRLDRGGPTLPPPNSSPATAFCTGSASTESPSPTLSRGDGAVEGADTGRVRQVLCPVLVGREGEARLLLDAVGQAAEGRGGALFVAGEAGVGKSRLVREVSREADARGLVVLTGRAVSGGVPVPYRPLAEAVLGGLRRGGLDLPELGALRLALDRLGPGWRSHDPAAVAESPVVIGEGLLRALSGGRRSLLVLEDLHWADPESLAVLEYLADNVSGEGIVCLGTIRPEEHGPGADLVGRLAQRRAARVVRLARLGDEATVEVALACLGTDVLPAPVEALLRTRADGLPFLVEELLAGLVNAGVLVEREGRWSTSGSLDWSVPPTFVAAVGRRLDALPARARGVLHAAALLGRRFDWSLLAAVTGADEAEVAAALRQAVSAQLLTAEATGFRHALTRDAVLDDLVAPERAILAGRTLAAIDRTHPGLPGGWCDLAAELAEASGDHRRAAELLLEAGRRAMTAGALATAEAALERARALVAGEPMLAARIDETLVDALALAGQVDRAFELGERLLARLDVASHLLSGGAELHVRLARAAVAAGRWPVAVEHLVATRSMPAARDAELAACLDAVEAQVALGQAQLGRAERLAGSALAAAERAGLPAVACEALEVAGRVCRQRDLDAAEAAFSRGLAVATAHGLELWRLRALHELGTLDQLRTESVDRLLQAREVAVEVGALALVATLDLQIAAGLSKQFRPEEALVAAGRSVDVSRRLRLATLPMALIHLAAAYAQRGEPEQVEACLAEAVALAPDDLDVRGCAWGHCRATVSVLAEDRERAVSEMTTGARLLLRSPATVAPPFLGLRVLLVAVDGDDDTVRAEAERVRDSGATRHRIVASLLGYADAVLLGRSGRGAEAAEVLSATDAEMGPLVDWYRQYARRLVAEAALADGWDVPVIWLREAAAFFAARGDLAVAAACRALLRRAGVAVPRPGPGGPSMPTNLRALGVTSREAEVLALVADGLTNKEMATLLHLSPRTIEKHVASLLTKTGCRRRAQLAGYSARLSG